MILKAIAGLLFFACGAFAQADEPKIGVNLDGLRYPPIAKQARIQGDVVFRVSAAGQEFISSAQEVLTPVAERNLKTWTLPRMASGTFIVIYHKTLEQRRHDQRDTDPAPTQRIEKTENLTVDVTVSTFSLCPQYPLTPLK